MLTTPSWQADTTAGARSPQVWQTASIGALTGRDAPTRELLLSAGARPSSRPASAQASTKESVTTMRSRLLVVDDDADQCSLLETLLSRLGYAVTTTTSPLDAIELVRNEEFSTILSDLDMVEMSGTEMCERIVGIRPDIPVIVVTGFGSMEIAVAAMRVGAYDFISKPVDAKLIALSIERAVKHHNMQVELLRLREVVSDRTALASLVGKSPAILRVQDLVLRVAESDASILIQGETGTGKELVARAIHNASGRKQGPFVAINCAAVPAQLLESELFGHVRGAFTDAKASRPGLFVQANNGTLFLDEVGEMPPEMQAKLLRALQERVVRPVGSEREVPFDARMLTATHRDLESDSDEGRFRKDLFYRINVVRIDVPPLRERGSDVLTLAPHFLEKFAARAKRPVITLSAPVAERLLAYDWPGNVRELENCIERAVALARFDQVTFDDLPEKIRAYRADRFVLTANEANEVVALDALERTYIFRVLKLVDGNKSRAAELLGLDRRTLYRKLDRYTAEGTGVGMVARRVVPEA